MEDYLNAYVHALASYRGVHQEDVEGGCVHKIDALSCVFQNMPNNSAGLMMKLIVLSESCPDDKGEIMPPSISGLVYNQVVKKKSNPFHSRF